METSTVVAEGDRVWTKVIDIAWTKRKYFLSRKYVNQEDGADLDEGQVKLDQEKAKALEQRAARAAQVVSPALRRESARFASVRVHTHVPRTATGSMRMRWCRHSLSRTALLPLTLSLLVTCIDNVVKTQCSKDTMW